MSDMTPTDPQQRTKKIMRARPASTCSTADQTAPKTEAI